MSAEVLVFDILAVIAVIAGIGVVLARNPVHSAVSLVVTFVNLAGIYVMLRAEFLAAVQIIVYTGAILVLVLFVIMLVQPEDLPEFHGGQPVQRALGLLIGLMLLGEVAAAVLTRTVVGQPGPWDPDAVARAGGNVQVLGQFLYSGYVLPIQSIAIVLLVGTIGALVLARPDELGGVRKRIQTTGTISLSHPRGMGAEFEQPAMLPAGATTDQATAARGEFRRGLIMVNDAEAYSEMPAWEVEQTGVDESQRVTLVAAGREAGRNVARSGEVLDGEGIGSEGREDE